MNDFLTQKQLAEKLVLKTGLEYDTARKFSALFFTIVKKGLKESESFSVHNFGTFKKIWVQTSQGINPSNGEKIIIPAHYRIKFSPCASVAKRLNWPYEQLKAKEIPDTQIEDSNKLNTNDESVNKEETKTSEIESLTKTLNKTETSPKNLNNKNDAKKIFNTKLLKAILIFTSIILLLILLFSILLKSCSKNKKNIEKENTKNTDENKNELTLQKDLTKQAETEKEITFEDFSVPDGGTYYLIAEKKYGNRHLWPIIFLANKNVSSDPDFVAKYKTIKIPSYSIEDFSSGKNDKIIVKAVLEAYNAYLLMCEKQPESKKNQERQKRAARVLVSGELLVPGFLAEYKNRILPEYRTLAENIIIHQYE